MTQSTQPSGSPADDRVLGTVMDVGTERVARVYAEAALGTAENRHEADDFLAGLESLVREVFEKDPQFEAFLSSGAVGRKIKADVIRKCFEQGASELFVNFLLVLNDHERLDLIRPILNSYRELRDQRAGRVRVEVRTAVALPDDQQERLRQQLRETLHLEPMLQPVIDPDLLGGMVVRVGDWLFDDSVRTRLDTLRNQIIARSSYEIQSGRNRFSSANGN